jgi:hypothetical protein
MIVGIDGNSVDGCGGNQRIVGYNAPGSGITAAVGRLPYAAPTAPKISHDAAIHRGGWIDRNGVHSSFSRRVIKTTGTTRHALWLRTERDKTRRAEGQWTPWIEHCRHACGDAHGQTRMLGCSCTQPARIKTACGICQTIIPQSFQASKIGSFGFGSVTGRRHIARRLLGVLVAENAGRKKRKQRTRKAKNRPINARRLKNAARGEEFFVIFNQVEFSGACS